MTLSRRSMLTRREAFAVFRKEGLLSDDLLPILANSDVSDEVISDLATHGFDSAVSSPIPSNEDVPEKRGGGWLRKLVAMMNPSHNTPHHCVRCHRTISNEYDGSSDTCVVGHHYNRMVQDYTDDAHGELVHHYTCCSKTWIQIKEEDPKTEEDDPTHLYCFKGKHTVDETRVEYNGMSIMTCQQEGCAGKREKD